MSKGTIKYSQEFKSEFGNKWIGIDLVVNENEDWDKMYSEAESMVKRWGGIWLSSTSYSLGTVPYDRSEPIVASPIPYLDYKAKEKLEIDIDNAKTVDELIVYKDEVWKFGLIDYYADKLDKLKSLTV